VVVVQSSCDRELRLLNTLPLQQKTLQREQPVPCRGLWQGLVVGGLDSVVTLMMPQAAVSNCQPVVDKVTFTPIIRATTTLAPAHLHAHQ
jgi:hypothetical protein